MQTELKKGNTSINEHARRELNLSRDEYALCQYVHYRVADPQQPIRGWCCDKKEEIADFVGISRAGLYKMLDRVISWGLVEADSTKGYLCSTRKWIDLDNNKRPQSRHDKKVGVNKVDTNCKQSLHDGVNLVTHNIEVEYDNKYDKSESEKGNAPAPAEISTLNTPLSIDPLPAAGAPETAPLISIRDNPKADTPSQLFEALKNFYKGRMQEWKDGVLNMAGGSKYTEAQREEIIKQFCAHTIKNNGGRNTYGMLNGDLQNWFLRQKDFQKPTPKGTPAATVYTKPGKVHA